MHSEVSQQLKKRAADYVASGAAATLSLVPVAGPFLAEIATSIIPGQQVDRIVDFASQLGDRVAGLELERLTASMNDEEFTDLVGESMRQAARSTSEERRSYLASLVANSLTREAIQHSESRHLLRILNELNDIEVLWLRYFNAPSLGGDKQFRALHADVFEPRDASFNSPPDEVDQKALQDSYKDHLVQLGLLRQKLSVDRNGAPEVDTFSGDFKHKGRETSPLGRLLLRSIGMIVDG